MWSLTDRMKRLDSQSPVVLKDSALINQLAYLKHPTFSGYKRQVSAPLWYFVFTLVRKASKYIYIFFLGGRKRGNGGLDEERVDIN